MSAPRLTSAIRVGAIRRLAEAEGGFATVLVKGDETSGAMLLVMREKGGFAGVCERLPASMDESNWETIQQDEGTLEAYLERRRRADPDLWLMELDVPDAARFTAHLPSQA